MRSTFYGYQVSMANTCRSFEMLKTVRTLSICSSIGLSGPIMNPTTSVEVCLKLYKFEPTPMQKTRLGDYTCVLMHPPVRVS
jgi:hypothetical protein